MRILIVCDFLFKYGAQQARSLVNLDHDVGILCRSHAIEFGGSTDERDKVVDGLRSEGVRIFVVPGRVRSISAVPAMLAIRRELRRFDPQVVHVHENHDPRLLALTTGYTDGSYRARSAGPPRGAGADAGRGLGVPALVPARRPVRRPRPGACRGACADRRRHPDRCYPAWDDPAFAAARVPAIAERAPVRPAGAVQGRRGARGGDAARVGAAPPRAAGGGRRGGGGPVCARRSSYLAHRALHLGKRGGSAARRCLPGRVAIYPGEPERCRPARDRTRASPSW